MFLGERVARSMCRDAPRAWPARERAAVSINLGSGAAGRLIAVSEAAAVLGNERFRVGAAILEHDLVRALETLELRPSYLDGLFGVVWAIKKAAELRGEPGDFDVSELSKAATAGLQRRRDLLFDLGGGLAGMTLSLSSFHGQPGVAAFLRAGVETFEATAKTDPATGGTFWTHPLYKRMLGGQPAGTRGVDLGVAHGTPGIIGVLVRIATREPALADRVAGLVGGAVRFVLSTRSHGSETSEFPYRIGDAGPVFPSRLAWCYGDPGVASVLVDAARFLGDGEILDAARETAVLSAARVLNGTEELEHCLCHGMAGLLVIFRKLARHFSDPELELAAEKLRDGLLGDALASIRKGEVPFSCQYFLDDDGTNIWPENDGLLFGASGVLLALLSELEGTERPWMAGMLLDEI